MKIELIPLISFVIITTFTPGPNNISSASMGVAHGYRKTLNYLLGITCGFFAVMIICAYLSSTLLTILPPAEQYLRWVGAGYIIWLAKGILYPAHSSSEPEQVSKAFKKGFFLQLFNPKVAIYGLTLYSTFLASISNRLDYLALSAICFALTAFAATSTWAVFGAVIRDKLENDSYRRKINMCLSILLIYSAIELSGVLAILARII